MTQPNDPSTCDSAAKEYVSKIKTDAEPNITLNKVYAIAEVSYKAGWSECEKVMNEIKAERDEYRHEAQVRQKKISMLEDTIYHMSRQSPEMEYKLGQRIEELESKLEVARTALEEIGHDQNLIGERSDLAFYYFQLANGALAKLTKESK